MVSLYSRSLSLEDMCSNGIRSGIILMVFYYSNIILGSLEDMCIAIFNLIFKLKKRIIKYELV